jgi:hypothetical protein
MEKPAGTSAAGFSLSLRLWWLREMDSNHRPADYESAALPLRYPAKLLPPERLSAGGLRSISATVWPPWLLYPKARARRARVPGLQTRSARAGRGTATNISKGISGLTPWPSGAFPSGITGLCCYTARLPERFPRTTELVPGFGSGGRHAVLLRCKPSAARRIAALGLLGPCRVTASGSIPFCHRHKPAFRLFTRFWAHTGSIGPPRCETQSVPSLMWQ